MIQTIRQLAKRIMQHCFSNAVASCAMRGVGFAAISIAMISTANAAFVAPQQITSTAQYVSSNVTSISSNTVLVTPLPRTPATISFLHLNTVTNLYAPAVVYHAGQDIYVQVSDGDQNTDPYTVQTVTVTLTDSVSGDSETIVLTETGPNTGVFIGFVPSVAAITGVASDGTIAVSVGSEISAVYTDQFDNTDTAASAVLVDPFGIVFDSATGAPVDGATVTIINVATGLPAIVFGDDAVSAYPSTVISGGSVTDASGAVYNFEPGNYRFPFMNLGSYRLEITPPVSYSFPSQATDAAIQALPTAPYALTIGSRGETFNIQAGPPLNIDVPLDSKSVNLFIQKTALTPQASIGSRVGYQISVENVHTATPSLSTVVTDTLPVGFRYQNDSATLDGVPLPNPTISANGRTLRFNLGNLAATTKTQLIYTTVVGANAKLGPADNIALASGVLAGVPVISNTTKATVTVSEDLIRSIGFIEGVVFVDDNLNEIYDKSENVVAGIRIFMEDGRSVVTDKDGRYHFNAVQLGTHVLQMDIITIHKRYEARGLTNTRFTDNDYSQFVEVNGGGLARANFRLLEREPEKAPVKVNHTLQEKEGVVWADVTISHGDEVEIFELTGFYMLPKGWSYVEGSALVGGKTVAPVVTPVGLSWKLDPSKAEQHFRLAMRGKGDSGLKQATAYARFVSPGTDKGRTGLAKINVQDTLKELRDQRSFALDVKFATRKAKLPESELVNLEKLVKDLDGLVIRELIVEGHTDNIQISKRNTQEFANNKVLSQARADYIAAYFQDVLKLDAKVVSAFGKGALEPIASNQTSKGRAMNRRVVLKVRADKVTHDFSSALQGDLADAEGEALGDWDYVKAVTIKEAVKDKGILSPTDGRSMTHAIEAIRFILPTNLRHELSLDSKVISSESLGFESANKETGNTTYTYIGVDFGAQGEHKLQLKGYDTFGNVRFEETVSVVRTGAIAKIKLSETGDNIADGKTPVRFRLKITDNKGNEIAGSTTLKQLGGDLLSTMRSETALVTNEVSQGIRVNADGWVEMAPVSTSGTHRITLGYNDIREEVELYVKPEVRDWILVGFAEGTLGFNKLSGATQTATTAAEEDKLYKDGRVAFYAKGQVSGDFLLTVAYDTAKKAVDTQNNRFGEIDPNSMYTIYGDGTQQQFNAASSKKLYVKIERDTFYALFGDYTTGLSTTELTRYSRTFTGVKAELHEDNLGFTAFATQTSLTAVKDDIRGNGTSGLYRLSRSNIVTNSETIRIETTDRFKSEVIFDSIQLVRHVDYDIDYVLGTIWFKQPVLSKDGALNPIVIRVEYESNDSTDEFTTAGGRVYVKPTDEIEFGGTYVSEGRLGTSNTLSGVDAKIQVTDDVEIRAEAASSVNNNITGKAWKVEALVTKEKVTAKAYARSQDDNFGLGQQLGSENSTLKVGADAQYRLDETSSLNAEVFRQETTNTGAVRDMASVQYNKQLSSFDVRAGLRSNQDKDGAGTKTGSTLANIGASKQITNRLKVRADHEEALSDNNGIDFPSRTGIGADYRLTSTTSLALTQEWTKGKAQDTTSTRVGINTTPWNGAQMSASYEQQLSENGKRSFANAGLLQTWKISEALSFSASIDQTKVLSKSAPIQLNLNAPTATGGEDFTAYSIGFDYKPGTWVWTNRLEYRTSDLSKHQGASMGVQGDIFENLVAQFTAQWQKDDLIATNGLNFASDLSLRAAWRPSYDQLVLLNRFDIRRSEQITADISTKSTRYINNMTANWQTTESWQIRFNHGIKLSNESLATGSWSGVTDLAGVYLIYDINDDWDLTMQSAALRVRHLNNYQSNHGVSLGYNVFDQLWLSLGYNFTGFYDQDFKAAEYAREGAYMRLRFKFDQDSLEEMLK